MSIIEIDEFLSIDPAEVEAVCSERDADKGTDLSVLHTSVNCYPSSLPVATIREKINAALRREEASACVMFAIRLARVLCDVGHERGACWACDARRALAADGVEL